MNLPERHGTELITPKKLSREDIRAEENKALEQQAVAEKCEHLIYTHLQNGRLTEEDVNLFFNRRGFVCRSFEDAEESKDNLAKNIYDAVLQRKIHPGYVEILYRAGTIAADLERDLKANLVKLYQVALYLDFPIPVNADIETAVDMIKKAMILDTLHIEDVEQIVVERDVEINAGLGYVSGRIKYKVLTLIEKSKESWGENLAILQIGDPIKLKDGRKGYIKGLQHGIDRCVLFGINPEISDEDSEDEFYISPSEIQEIDIAA